MWWGFCSVSIEHTYISSLSSTFLVYTSAFTALIFRAPASVPEAASNCTLNIWVPVGGGTSIAGSPRLQLRLLSSPWRCAEHRIGHKISVSQATPSNPASHKHTPSMQSPLCEQSRGHRASEQSTPVNKGSQRQLSFTHFPRPEQKF